MQVRYILGISYVNRKDLLYKAVASVKEMWPHTIVIDNSDGRDLRGDAFLAGKVHVFEPPVPLTVPQKFNYLQELAEERKCDVYLHMHDDAEAEKGSAAAFLEAVRALRKSGRRWGIAFTNYDVLSAFNMEAVRKTGEWDGTFLQYCSDNDYYWRLHLAGYEFVWTGVPVKHYGSSSTWSDMYRAAVFKVVLPLHGRYYKKKWGGDWYKEKYSKPFTPQPLSDAALTRPKWVP